MLRALLIGFGGVGRRMARILSLERDRFSGLRDLDLAVIGITTRSRGSLANPAGVDLPRALQEVEDAGLFSLENPERSSLDSLAAARELDYDALVELSTLDIRRRGEPALSYLREALERGRHAVTANKGPVAFALHELDAISRGRGGRLLFESTVMDGAPLFGMARASLRGCRVQAVEGILNSTTNFVLSRLEKGESMERAVETARETGFAEADPSMDLDGWDAAAKLSILAGVLMEEGITPPEVEREGLHESDAGRIREAPGRGLRVKQICRAWREGGRVRARVGLEELPVRDPLARVEGSGSALRIHTDLMGPILLLQERPTLNDTAYGVLNDLLSLG